jgi:hypothetical protein
MILYFIGFKLVSVRVEGSYGCLGYIGVRYTEKCKWSRTLGHL